MEILRRRQDERGGDDALQGAPRVAAKTGRLAEVVGVAGFAVPAPVEYIGRLGDKLVLALPDAGRRVPSKRSGNPSSIVIA